MGKLFGTLMARKICQDTEEIRLQRPDDIVEFSNKYFPLNFDAKRPNMGPDMPDLTEEWLRHWQEMADRGLSSGIIGPPGYTKTATAERIALRLISKNPNIAGAYATRTDKKTLQFVDGLRTKIEKNPQFQKDFGIYPDYNDWSKHQFKVLRSIASKEPTFFGTSIGGQFESSRISFLIMDDIADKRSMRSPAERLAIEDFVLTTAIQRVDPGGLIFFIGSRWDIRDIYGKLIKNEEFTDPVTGESTVKVCKAEPSPGVSLSEVIFPYSALLKKKDSVGLPIFNLRYQQVAGDLDNRPFHTPFRADTRYILGHRIWFRFFAMDLNASDRPDSNLTVAVFFSVLVNGQVIIDSMYTDHRKRDYDIWLSECIADSTSGYFAHTPKMGWIEDFGFQAVVIEDIKDSFAGTPFQDIRIEAWGRKKKKSEIPGEIHFTYQDLKKEHRIVASLEAPIRNRILGVFEDEYIKRPGVHDIANDLENFPDVEFFDPCDAVAIGMINIRPHLNITTVQEKKDGRGPRAFKSRPGR